MRKSLLLLAMACSVPITANAGWRSVGGRTAPLNHDSPSTRVEPQFDNKGGGSINAIDRLLPPGRLEPRFGSPGDSATPPSLPGTEDGTLRHLREGGAARNQALETLSDATLKQAADAPRLVIEAPEVRKELVQKPATQKALDKFDQALTNAIPEESRRLGVSDASLRSAQRQELSDVINSLLEKLPNSAFQNGQKNLKREIKNLLEAQAKTPGDSLASFNIVTGNLKIKRNLYIGPKGKTLEVELGEIPLYKVMVLAGTYMLLCGDTFCQAQIAEAVDYVLKQELVRRITTRGSQHAP